MFTNNINNLGQFRVPSALPAIGNGIKRAAGSVKNSSAAAMVNKKIDAASIMVREAATQAKCSAIKAVSGAAGYAVGFSNVKNAFQRLTEAHRSNVVLESGKEIIEVYTPSVMERISGALGELTLGSVKGALSFAYVAGGVSTGLEAIYLTSAPEADSYEGMGRSFFNGINSATSTFIGAVDSASTLAANWVVIPAFNHVVCPAWNDFVSPAITSAAKFALANPVNTAFAVTITGFGISAAADLKNAITPAKIKVLTNGKESLVKHKGPKSLTQRLKNGGKGLIKLAIVSGLTMAALDYNKTTVTEQVNSLSLI